MVWWMSRFSGLLKDGVELSGEQVGRTVSFGLSVAHQDYHLGCEQKYL